MRLRGAGCQTDSVDKVNLSFRGREASDQPAESRFTAGGCVTVEKISLHGLVEFLVHQFQIGLGLRNIFFLHRGQKTLGGLLKIRLNVEVMHVSFVILA